MINCIIVDDEDHAIDVLKHHIRSVRQINLKACFTNPAEAITYLEGHQIDLIFLDINMPELSGIEFIQTVRHSNYHFVLTTAYREFATHGFDLDVVDYLVKPIPLARFLQAVTKVQKLIVKPKADTVRVGGDDDYFIVTAQSKNKLVKINIDEIDYIEGMKNYVAFHHNGTRTLSLITLKDVEERLASKRFMRVQKSFIVALDKVVAINGNNIILKGISSEIMIGDTYKKLFLETIRKNLIV